MNTLLEQLIAEFKAASDAHAENNADPNATERYNLAAGKLAAHVAFGTDQNPKPPARLLEPLGMIDDRIPCPKCGERNTYVIRKTGTRQFWWCDNCEREFVLDTSATTAAIERKTR